MPRFHVHLRTPDKLERDARGLDRPDLEAVYLEVCRTIPALCADLLHEGKAPLACTFLICDAADTLLMEVPFSERLHDGHRPARPCASPSSGPLKVLTQVADARRLVAAMRADVTEMAAAAVEARARAQHTRSLLRRPDDAAGPSTSGVGTDQGWSDDAGA